MTRSGRPSGVVVFACGERLRGDDGVAHAATDGLPKAARAASLVRQVPTVWPDDLAGLAEGWVPIIVDAVVGVPPGRLVRLDLDQLDGVPQVRPTSSHQMPLDMVMGLAQLMGWQPRGIFLGVGCARFGHGEPLSPEVERAVPELRAAISREIEGLSAS